MMRMAEGRLQGTNNPQGRPAQPEILCIVEFLDALEPWECCPTSYGRVNLQNAITRYRRGMFRVVGFQGRLFVLRGAK